MPRHWFDEAKRVDFPEAQMQAIIDQAIRTVNLAIADVSSWLPENFPDNIAKPVFDRLKK